MVEDNTPWLSIDKICEINGYTRSGCVTLLRRYPHKIKSRRARISRRSVVKEYEITSNLAEYLKINGNKSAENNYLISVKGLSRLISRDRIEEAIKEGKISCFVRTMNKSVRYLKWDDVKKVFNAGLLDGVSGYMLKPLSHLEKSGELIYPKPPTNEEGIDSKRERIYNAIQREGIDIGRRYVGEGAAEDILAIFGLNALEISLELIDLPRKKITLLGETLSAYSTEKILEIGEQFLEEKSGLKKSSEIEGTTTLLSLIEKYIPDEVRKKPEFLKMAFGRIRELIEFEGGEYLSEGVYEEKNDVYVKKDFVQKFKDFFEQRLPGHLDEILDMVN